MLHAMMRLRCCVYVQICVAPREHNTFTTFTFTLLLFAVSVLFVGAFAGLATSLSIQHSQAYPFVSHVTNAHVDVKLWKQKAMGQLRNQCKTLLRLCDTWLANKDKVSTEKCVRTLSAIACAY